MKELFSEGLIFRLNGRLYIESEKDLFLGPGRIELLEKIAQYGSISKFYFSADQFSKELNNQPVKYLSPSISNPPDISALVYKLRIQY